MFCFPSTTFSVLLLSKSYHQKILEIFKNYKTTRVGLFIYFTLGEKVIFTPQKTSRTADSRQVNHELQSHSQLQIAIQRRKVDGHF